MRVISSNQESLALAANILLDGGVVCIPTDTVYGLAASAIDEKAVLSVFSLKRRRRSLALPVLVNSTDIVEDCVQNISYEARTLAEEFWPGALTMIFDSAGIVPNLVTAGTGKLAVRIPNHMVPLSLCQQTGVPIIGTSANTSGKPPLTSARNVEEHFSNSSLRLVIDGGDSKSFSPSTVIDVSCSPPFIVREGVLSKGEIFDRCGIEVE